MNNLEKQMMKRMIIWTAAGIALSYAINVGMYLWLGDAAFPWNILLLVGIFLLIGYVYMKRQIRKLPPGASFLGTSEKDSSSLKYECPTCGVVYKGKQCPRCGNKGGRAIFG